MPGELSLPLARVAVSDCLRGRAVRWDGDHNGDGWPRHAAEKLFALVGICPEVGIGMGVPREPIHLVEGVEAGTGRGSVDPAAWADPRAVAVADPRRDYTARLTGYVRQVAPILDGVDGYIFADRSPSCGLAGVKVFANGQASPSHRPVGRGVYAAAIVAAYPTLPVADGETLADEDALFDFALAVVARGAGDVEATGLRDTVRQLLQVSR